MHLLEIKDCLFLFLCCLPLSLHISGTAYVHGMKHATGNFVIIMDADLSHHVCTLKHLWVIYLLVDFYSMSTLQWVWSQFVE